MRKRRLFYNTISSTVYQITVVVCGFVLPRLILNTYGSQVNGLVNSISQFLGIISFLQLGVGRVVESTLYKPLAEKRIDEISRIIASASKFFRTIAGILVVYTAFLAVVYPRLINKDYSALYSSTLIIIISISSFAQYYFGLVNFLLLSADQRGYIQYTLQTLATVLNTVICFVLVNKGFTIHAVKLAASLIYLIVPVTAYIYVKNHYDINARIKYDTEPIEQKWNGVAQHVAACVLDNTDTIVLTLMSTLANVSIYSVHFMVVNGVKQLLISATNGIHALMGELWAKQERDKLESYFSMTEWAIHSGTVFIFGVTAILIVPFVLVYTAGITDADYKQPLFAFLIVLANAGHCLRTPYNTMILAAGHYKQTQSNYIVAAAMNVVVSVLTVKLWGLVGVALGTLAAMMYQTVWMAIYNSKHILKRNIAYFIKQMSVDVLSFALMLFASSQFELSEVSYFAWVILAVKVSLISAGIMLLINAVFYREKLISLLSILKLKRA